MNTTQKKRWVTIIATLVMVGICILVLGLVYFSSRAKAFNSRPLVLIHNPINYDEVDVGDALNVHATARSDKGLERIELWANDSLIAVQHAPEGTSPTNLTISKSWLVLMEGSNILISRAYSTDGTSGQAAVEITAQQPEETNEVSQTAAEGEDQDRSTSDSSATSGGSDGGAGPTGSESEPRGGEAPETPGEEEAPNAEAQAPGSLGLFDLLMGIGGFETIDLQPEPVMLRLEIKSLHTGAAYDGLHCYVEVANSSPQWYPDSDHNQATDESFAALGGGWWEVGEQLAGDNAPVIRWPANQPLPFAVSCVGVVAGTEALELGRWEWEMTPGEWDGEERQVEVEGLEGNYSFSYRVSPESDVPRGIPCVIVPDMRSPTNARLDNTNSSLRWDYDPPPPEEEEPINGFRIYLNGTLQWIESPEARASRLPYEWFHPPCGATYIFGVSAFRYDEGLIDGIAESYPAITRLEQSDEDCTQRIQITFLTLETFNLGGDGDQGDFHGDVGPVYGYFYANDAQIHFDGLDFPAWWESTVDLPYGLNHNHVYSLGDASWNYAFHGITEAGPYIEAVGIPEGGTFQFGYSITDRDTGRCRDSDDAGCPDLVCEADSPIILDTMGEFDHLHEGRLFSDDDRCVLTYEWQPVIGSPRGTSVEGGEPLPYIEVEEEWPNSLIMYDRDGNLVIHVRNTGSAAWPGRDLTVEFFDRVSGESIGFYTWPEFELEVGERTILEAPADLFDWPDNICIIIDPNDEVPEEGGHEQVCNSRL